MVLRHEQSPRPSRREAGLDPAPGLLVAVVMHIVLYYVAGTIDPPEKPKPRELHVVEVIEVPPPERPKPPPPPPKLEEPPPPEQPKPLEAPKPEPKVVKKAPKPKVEAKPEPETKTEPAPPPKPKRFELPESQTVPEGQGGDVKVKTGGDTGSGTGDGKPGGTGTKPGTGDKPGSGGGKGTGEQAGTPWAPKNDLYISQQPRALRVPELECPAVSERQVSGTVVLLVQVQKDGKIRSARVTKKMGHGCDDIAKKAMKQAKFAPAVGTDGKPADYELRYEYVFELRD